MKYVFFLILWTWLGFGFAQKSIDWELLSEVRYTNMVDMRTAYITQKPRLSKNIKELENEVVEISGYILPLNVSGDAYVLSRYPYAACFFCGGAGLESVMDIWFKEPDQFFELDQFVRIRGTLRLSVSGQGLIYLLDEAEAVN